RALRSLVLERLPSSRNAGCSGFLLVLLLDAHIAGGRASSPLGRGAGRRMIFACPRRTWPLENGSQRSEIIPGVRGRWSPRIERPPTSVGRKQFPVSLGRGPRVSRANRRATSNRRGPFGTRIPPPSSFPRSLQWYPAARPVPVSFEGVDIDRVVQARSPALRESPRFELGLSLPAVCPTRARAYVPVSSSPQGSTLIRIR